MAACRNLHLEAARFLIKRGAALDLFDRAQFSALRWAALHGDVAMVRLLLQHNASVTKDGYTANSALEIAEAESTKNHRIIVQLLQNKLGT